jgi:DMSO/TMAO reductase YedYZ molybdopterin-dependent catalytic subunit
VIEKTPDFVKSLDVAQIMDDEVLLAHTMNGEPLPMLNGFPLRLVVPGHYGTYWVKHVNELTVVGETFDGFFMSTAYRIPDTAGNCVEPGNVPKSTIPIQRFTVRSFLTSVVEGTQLPVGRETLLRGIAFDSGAGLTEVLVSTDGGQTWRAAQLGKDLGRYSFREWTLPWTPPKPGTVELKCRVFNRVGETQPIEPLWNPSGYLRNVVETTKVSIV